MQLECSGGSGVHVAEIICGGCAELISDAAQLGKRDKKLNIQLSFQVSYSNKNSWSVVLGLYGVSIKKN